jgi:membrane-associated phospholipid phosphatase
MDPALKETLRSRTLWSALGIFALAVTVCSLASFFSFHTVDELPHLPDRILTRIPVLHASWSYDILAILAMTLFIIYTGWKRPKEAPYFFILFAIAYTVRAVFISIAPLGEPIGADTGLLKQWFGSYVHGMFPSGHTQAGVLAILLAHGRWKIALAILTTAMAVLLILARGHYVIDVLGAAIFAYAIYMFGETQLRRYWTIE